MAILNVFIINQYHDAISPLETNEGPGSSRNAKNYQNQRILSPRFRRFIDDHLSILRLLVRHDPKVIISTLILILYISPLYYILHNFLVKMKHWTYKMILFFVWIRYTWLFMYSRFCLNIFTSCLTITPSCRCSWIWFERTRLIFEKNGSMGILIY